MRYIYQRRSVAIRGERGSYNVIALVVILRDNSYPAFANFRADGFDICCVAATKLQCTIGFSVLNECGCNSLILVIRASNGIVDTGHQRALDLPNVDAGHFGPRLLPSR